MNLALSVERTERMDLREVIEEKLISTSRTHGMGQLAEEIESNLSITSSPFFDAEQLLETLHITYNKLLEKRNRLLELPFFSLRPAQKKELKNIDHQLDSLELDIVKLRKEFFKREMKAIENIIEDNDHCIKKFSSK